MPGPTHCDAPPTRLSPEGARDRLLRAAPAVLDALTDALASPPGDGRGRAGTRHGAESARDAARLLLFRAVLRLVRGVDDPADGFDPAGVAGSPADPLADPSVVAALEPLPGPPDGPFRAALPALGVDVLGDLHERLAGQTVHGRRTAATYYTPAVVVRDMVARALAGLRLGDLHLAAVAPADVRVLDPALGSGRFLCEAARLLAVRDREPAGAACSPRGVARLVGVDADPFALRLAQVLLAETLRDTDRDSGGGVASGTLDPAHIALVHGDALLLLAERSGALAQPFDLVVGNPPYGAVASPGLRAALRPLYPLHRGAFDRYRLFLEAALAALVPGGRAALLVPTTWMTLRHAAPLRARILEAYNLREVTRLGRDAFPGVQVDVAAVHIERSAPDGRPVLLRHAPSLAHLAAGDVRVSEASAAAVLGLRRALLAPAATSRAGGDPAQGLHARLVAAHPPARAHARFVCGLKPYQRGKGSPPQTGAEGRDRRFEVDGPVDPSCRPLLVGRHVRPFTLAWEPDAWLRYGPWLAEPRSPAVFDAPLKLVGRQTGNRIVVAPDEARRVARDSTYLVLAPPDAPAPAARRVLLWLLAVLNDPIATWLFHQSDPDEVDKTFPQVRVSSVGRLPIPSLDRLTPADAADALAAVEARVSAGATGDLARGAAAEVTLRALVARAYGISASAAEDLRRLAP